MRANRSARWWCISRDWLTSSAAPFTSIPAWILGSSPRMTRLGGRCQRQPPEARPNASAVVILGLDPRIHAGTTQTAHRYPAARSGTSPRPEAFFAAEGRFNEGFIHDDPDREFPDSGRHLAAGAGGVQRGAERRAGAGAAG